MMRRAAANPVLKLEEGIVRLELVVIVGALAMILICIALNVIDRFFAMPWPDLSEPALIGMSLLAFIGGAYAVRFKAHIAIELVHSIPGSLFSRICSVAADVAILLLSVLIILYGYDFLDYVYSVREKTVELRIPLVIPVGSMLLGAVLSVFHVLCGWFRPAAGTVARSGDDQEEPTWA